MPSNTILTLGTHGPGSRTTRHPRSTLLLLSRTKPGRPDPNAAEGEEDEEGHTRNLDITQNRPTRSPNKAIQYAEEQKNSTAEEPLHLLIETAAPPPTHSPQHPRRYFTARFPVPSNSHTHHHTLTLHCGPEPYHHTDLIGDRHRLHDRSGSRDPLIFP